MLIQDVVRRLYDETGIMSGRNKLNYYDKIGLINPGRGDNKYRTFSEKDYVRIKFIAILTDLGISTTDISNMLKSKDAYNVVKQLNNKEKNIEYAYTQIKQ